MEFANLKNQIADVSASSGDILKLNVGGTVIQASRAVLTLVKGSVLEAMFSGRHPIKQLDSGEYFIDRAPHIFGLVLEYLRNGCRIAQIEDNFMR